MKIIFLIIFSNLSRGALSFTGETDKMIDKLKNEFNERLKSLESAVHELESENSFMKDLINKLHVKNTLLDSELKKNEKLLLGKSTQLELKTNQIEKDVASLQNSPYFSACAYQYRESVTSKVITYDKLLYSSTNIDGADLNKETGVFTSGLSGTYTISWNLRAVDNDGNSALKIFLKKNYVPIEESRHVSYYTNNSGMGMVYDQGGRVLIIHMDPGDVLTLYCNDCSATIYDITLHFAHNC